MVHLKQRRTRVFPGFTVIQNCHHSFRRYIFFDFASILFTKQCRDTSVKYIETARVCARNCVCVKYEFSLSKREKYLRLEIQSKTMKGVFNPGHLVIQIVLLLSRAEIINSGEHPREREREREDTSVFNTVSCLGDDFPSRHAHLESLERLIALCRGSSFWLRRFPLFYWATARDAERVYILHRGCLVHRAISRDYAFHAVECSSQFSQSRNLIRSHLYSELFYSSDVRASY